MGKLSLLTLVCVLSLVKGLPLYTNSRWIVNESGERVKLACVNWVAHLDAMVAEGLSKQPVDVISKGIKSMGFNCVRLTWALVLVTDDSLASLTVRQSFQNLGLLESIAGIQTNNPSIVDLTLIQAYQVVVKSLGDNNVMVILDNHITQPTWCCSNFDGNGFFGDRYFDPDLWINGLTKMATIFNGITNVVGMSLRNELRGPKQNVKDWYRYMEKGAEAVHAANPDVLVILSGLNYDKDLSFLRNQQVQLSFTGKLVFEVHWYAFTDGRAWESGNTNQVCGQVAGNVMRLSGFLLDQGWPLFVSEFGVDLRGTNENDNRYLNCFMAVAAEQDLDWALWTLVGSYYIRQGVVGMNEYYGLLDWDWSQVRNTSFLQRISALQRPFRGPGFSGASSFEVIFHPLTGLCVIRKSLIDPLMLGPCSKTEHWRYTPQKILTIKGTYFCLQADQVGKPAKLGMICTGPSSKWEMISDSKMHLSSKDRDGSTVCLDVDSNNIIVTSTCKCLSRDRTCDPGTQWFKLVDSTRSSLSTELELPSSFLQRISALQRPFRGPGFSAASSFEVIFHPLTGLCVIRKSLIDPLMLGPCSKTEHWRYTPQKILTIKGTYFCLQADQVGKPAKLGIICTGPSSKWEMISDSKMHLSSKDRDGSTVCLDVDSNNIIVTNTCKCLSRDRACDPGTQWFKLVDSTRSSLSTELELPSSDLAGESFSSM